MAKKTTKAARITDDDPDIERMRQLLEADMIRLAEEHDPARRQTTSRTVQMWFAEIRKAEGAAAKRLGRITRPLVIAWGRTLAKEERQSMVRELAAIDSERNLLA